MVFDVTRNFERDGTPVKLISGAIHYFRILPELWRESLERLKACGLNCVETYMPWNLHEKEKGRFDFDGILDVERFLSIAQELGLMAIVRPGPYICAEWDSGGFPWWLINEPDLRPRCLNEAYLRCVDAYFDEALPRIAQHLVTRGGNVIMMQVENEYGSYGNDEDYLRHLRDGMIRRGIDVPLFTSDGPETDMLTYGTLEGCLSTVNFGSRPDACFAALRAVQPDRPLMCMEFWNGWFDHWGTPHHTRDAADVAATTQGLLDLGSLNLYMFQGGTNFGFLNGANYNEKYMPTVSSYDYHAPVSECGDVRESYRLIRDIAERYADAPLPPVPPNRAKRAYGVVRLAQSVGLFDAADQLAAPRRSRAPEPMERYGQGYGYILYRTRPRLPGKAQLKVWGLADRATVYVDRRLFGTIYRNDDETSIEVDIPTADSTIDLLVENMGRVNYGIHILEPKGIQQAVTLMGRVLFDWEVYCLPMDDLRALRFVDGAPGVPSAFYRGVFSVDEPCDTFLRTDGLRKGTAFLNGFHLGRYWEIGPTRTLYVPAPLLRRGENEIMLFESDGARVAECELTDRCEL